MARVGDEAAPETPPDVDIPMPMVDVGFALSRRADRYNHSLR
jgi:hypothetical protein